MEFATDQTIAELFASQDRRRYVRNGGPKLAKPLSHDGTPPATSGASKIAPACKKFNCRSGKCGTCARCLDNAKWERVFNEKFADPNYYKGSQIRNGSSLSWL